MGLQWKQGEPIVKVYGVVTANNPAKYGTVISSQVVNVFIKNVNGFSEVASQSIIYESKKP